VSALQRRLDVTTVYVTHDQVEAMTMGDRVAVLKDGLLMQCDTPLNLYERPLNVFVAGFIGSPAMNIQTFKVADGHARVADIDVPLPRATLDAVAREGADSVVLGFRPESLEPSTRGAGFPVHVDMVEELGSDAYAYDVLEGTASDVLEGGIPIVARVDARRPPSKSSTVFFQVREGEQHAFSAKTGERLPS
jgi:multiple sugar transport system ATP-binding protein